MGPIFTLFGAKIGPPNRSKTVPKSIFRVLSTRSCQTHNFVTPPHQKPYFCSSRASRKSSKFHLMELFHLFENAITNLSGSGLQFCWIFGPKKVPKKTASCLPIPTWYQSVLQRSKIAAFAPLTGYRILVFPSEFLPKIRRKKKTAALPCLLTKYLRKDLLHCANSHTHIHTHPHIFKHVYTHSTDRQIDR